MASEATPFFERLWASEATPFFERLWGDDASSDVSGKMSRTCRSVAHLHAPDTISVAIPVLLADQTAFRLIPIGQIRCMDASRCIAGPGP